MKAFVSIAACILFIGCATDYVSRTPYQPKTTTLERETISVRVESIADPEFQPDPSRPCVVMSVLEAYGDRPEEIRDYENLANPLLLKKAVFETKKALQERGYRVMDEVDREVSRDYYVWVVQVHNTHEGFMNLVMFNFREYNCDFPEEQETVWVVIAGLMADIFHEKTGYIIGKMVDLYGEADVSGMRDW